MLSPARNVRSTTLPESTAFSFVRTKLKAVDSGKVVERTFRAGESMPRVQTSTEDVQYLFDDGTNYVFMRVENYEQVPLPHAAVADEVAYLKEGDVAQLLSLDDVPTSLQLPASVELVVSQTEPGVKGDTVSNVTKAATLETGAVVQVPLFVNEGDRVKVDTRDGHYVSRA